MMQITKKVLSMILTFVILLGLLPATTFATETAYVYISASDEGQFITDGSGKLVAHRAVALDELTGIDLNKYGLSDYQYDANGDGEYEITALHLYIYTHEQIMGGNWNSDVTVTGSAGSIYFADGLFGFSDENLRYNYNGKYPANEEGWGFTADQIVLSAGDYLDVAHYSDWMFYADSAYGFNYFVDDSDAVTHTYTTEVGTALSVKLMLVGGGMGMGDTKIAQAGHTVYYGKTIGQKTGSVITDDNGAATITFSDTGTYYVWCDGGEGVDMAAGAIVSSPASATVTVSAKEEDPAPETPRQPQSVSAVLNATMAQLATTVTAPAFGTNAGEWTVFSLARGNYYAKDNAYFTDYYTRIVETVNTTAAKVNLNGALHKYKSTDNSRLIVALSAIGKDATSVGDWDLTAPYSDFTWVKKQGINGTIWALIALDSNNYATTDPTVRQQCVDSILSLQHDDGGWALTANKAYASDPDVTGMALTALYPYRNQPAVAEACAEAFTCLSKMQHENGTFASGGSECSESCAWVMVACTAWGINPDTDSRFIKNGNSVVDGLLAHYLSDSATFQHIIGAGSNAMATDQSCYALVAYDRLLKGKTGLYDYSDVTFDAAPNPNEMTATLGLPAEINAGDAFNAVISINQWDNKAGYKLIDLIVNVPAGVSVIGVTAGNKLAGGELSWNLEAETGKLRVVYFDANKNTDLTISGEQFPAELFTIAFKADGVTSGSKLNLALSGMSVKKFSDSSDEEAMVVVDTDTARGTVNVVVGISFSAVCLYTGDDVDLIPSTKKAVAVAITGIADGSKLTYNDEVVFQYSPEITAKTGVATYVAMVDANIDMANFINPSYFKITSGEASAITFGDSNGDGVINAQDALAAVDTWLRKGEEPTDDQILTLNVNGDSRINTFDALGIVEAFVNGTEYGVVTKAATITTNQ